MSDIEYRHDGNGLTAEHLTGFFEGWPDPPQPETHLELLRRSAEIVLAVEPETQRVIGFVNLLTDRVLSAYIPLLEVLPEFRGQGIGAELIRRVLARVPEIYMVDVTCDANVQPFYETLGFKRSLGASLRRYEHQAGSPSPLPVE